MFLEGNDLPSLGKECEKGIQLCKSEKFDEAMAPKIKELESEFESIKLKTEARIQKTNALELK